MVLLSLSCDLLIYYSILVKIYIKILDNGFSSQYYHKEQRAKLRNYHDYSIWSI